MHEIGSVKLVQLQPASLQIPTAESHTGYLYDPSGIVVVDQLTINHLGIEAVTHEGKHLLDIHHISHPDKEYDEDDLICIGFTSHYAAMRKKFGEHMTDGIAGENIIVDFDQEVWIENIGEKIGIKNQDSGKISVLSLQVHTDPCVEFCQYSLRFGLEKAPAKQIKDALQFLSKGRRGYLFVLDKAEKEMIVQPGDLVFSLG